MGFGFFGGGNKSSSSTTTNLNDSRTATSGELSPVARDNAVQKITITNTTTDFGAIAEAGKIAASNAGVAETALTKAFDFADDVIGAQTESYKDALNFGGAVLNASEKQSEQLASSFDKSIAKVAEAQKSESERIIRTLILVGGGVFALFFASKFVKVKV